MYWQLSDGQSSSERSKDAKEIAWKAQHRLHDRFTKLKLRGKPQQKVVTAVARELLGFVWAIGVSVERDQVSTKYKTRAAA